MCVLSYMPIHDGGFILTNNRDESVFRSAALPPKKYKNNLFYPKDQQSKGTWILTSPAFSVVLLNGAAHKHSPSPPYKHSRGLVPIHFMQIADVAKFIKTYDAEDIEPFTLLIFRHQLHADICMVRWDGKDMVHQGFMGSQPHIWSSATLYTAEVQQRRAGEYASYSQSAANSDPEKLMAFHKENGGADPANRLLVDRGNLKTIALSQICWQPDSHTFMYEDLRLAKTTVLRIFNDLG